MCNVYVTVCMYVNIYIYMLKYMCIIKRGRAFQFEATHLDSGHRTWVEKEKQPTSWASNFSKGAVNIHIRPKHFWFGVSTPLTKMSHFGSSSKKRIKKVYRQTCTLNCDSIEFLSLPVQLPPLLSSDCEISVVHTRPQNMTGLNDPMQG